MRLYKVKDTDEVLSAIREKFASLGTEKIGLAAAGGRIAAEDIAAGEDVPGFDRSAVDGYAVLAHETFGAGETLPAMLALAGEVRMGEPALPLAAGSCLYLPTGGMLPLGADAVIMVEDTELTGDIVNCHRQAAPGENVLRRGEDVAAGRIVIARGRKLRAAEIGVLASLGISELTVTKKPRVVIFSSGNEVVPYTTKTLPPGKVRDSNAPALAELAIKYGACPKYAGILEDNYTAFRGGIEDMLRQADFLVLSGGSSVGARDYTARVMRELSEGGLLTEGVAISPGKPTLLAKCAGKPVLGLPGHPVSALNIFSIFGRAIIERLLGSSEERFVSAVRATLSRNLPSRPGRTDYVRVRLERRGQEVQAAPIYGKSGILRSLADADGIIVIPSGSEGLPAGTEVNVLILD